MTPTCIAFEIKENNEIEILTINTPYTSIRAAMEHFRENLGARTFNIHDIKPPCRKIEPEDILVKDVSHLTHKDQLLLKETKTVEELETLIKKSERNLDLDFTDPKLHTKINKGLTAIKEKGTMNVREIYHILIPKLIGKI
jgi:hypothetical protein